MNNTFQAVYTVEDYCDGPRSGVAGFEGHPHYYRSVYLDTPQWNPNEDRFELSPVTPEVVAAACEAAAIFQRWDAKQRRTPGFTFTDEEFGALPEERARRHELEQFLESSYTAAARAKRMLVHGEFRVSDSAPSRFQVRWKLAESDKVA